MNDSHSDKNFSSSEPTHWWGRIDLLWWLFVPLCVLWYALLLPMGPNDLWYHARAGREIVALGHIPSVNTFSDSPPWVTPQTPYFFQSWLSDWLLFQILQWWSFVRRHHSARAFAGRDLDDFAVRQPAAHSAHRA